MDIPANDGYILNDQIQKDINMDVYGVCTGYSKLRKSGVLFVKSLMTVSMGLFKQKFICDCY